MVDKGTFHFQTFQEGIMSIYVIVSILGALLAGYARARINEQNRASHRWGGMFRSGSIQRM